MTDTPHNPLAAPGIEKLREHLRKHPHEAKETDATILVSLWTKTPLYELLHLRNEVERLTAENKALRAMKERPDYYHTTAVMQSLRRFVKTAGGQREAARRLSISSQYINDLLHGRRDITEKLAQALGYQRIVVFEKFREDKEE